MKDTKAINTKTMKVALVKKSSAKKAKPFKKDKKIKSKKSEVYEKMSAEIMEQSIQAADGNNTTLYVSKLDHKLGFKLFQLHFAKFGKVSKCYLSGSDHNNKGFGFVTYETEEDMKKALDAEHKLKGKVPEVRICEPKPKTTEKASKKRKLDDDSASGPPSKKVCKAQKHEVYAGGLPADLSVDEIKEYFSQFGDVASVFEPKQLDSKNLKYVFVAFKEASSLEAALAVNNHQINDTEAVVKSTKKDDATVEEVVKDEEAPSDVLRNADPKAFERTLFVGHLDYSTTKKSVLEYFCKKGKVTGLTMPCHPRKQTENKGFALVEFDTSLALQKALRMRKVKIDGKDIKISASKEPKAKGKEAKKVAAGEAKKHALFVAQIPAHINNKALSIHFSSYGPLASVIRPMRQRKLANYAFIQFQTREGMDAALADSTHKIAGEPLVVRLSKQEDKTKKVGSGEAKNGVAGDVAGMDVDEEEKEDDDEGEDMDDSDE